MAGLQVPWWQMKAAGLPSKPAPTSPSMPVPGASAGTDPRYNPNPAGFTTTQNNGSSPTNPTGSTGSGYVPGNFSQTPGSAPIPGVSPTGVTWGVDPTGMATPYTPYSNPGGETFWRPGESTNLYDQQMQRMLQMLKAFKGEAGGPVSMNREPGLTLAGRETPTTMADRVPAETAAFARAKERLGKIAGGATTALRDSATAGGRSGSGLEQSDQRGIVEQLQASLGDVVRDQTMDRLERHDDVDDRNLSAGIAQRGQDIGQYATEFGGNIQQRGQDFQGAMNDPMRQMMMQMLPGFMQAINFLPRSMY